MKKHVLSFALACGLAASTLPAAAQTSQPAQQPDANQETWHTSCAGPDRNADDLNCSATANVVLSSTHQLLFSIHVNIPHKNDKATPSIVLQGPLGFYLPDGIKLAVDDTALATGSVDSCDNRGCFIQVPASSKMLDALKRGSNLKIDFAPAANQHRTVTVPLTGFTKAMASIQ